MKIDSSSFTLSSAHEYSETQQLTIEREFEFSALLDRRLAGGQSPAVSAADRSEQIRNRFLDELEKLRELSNALVDCLNQTGRGGLQVHRLDLLRLGRDGGGRSGIAVTWQYTEQQTFSYEETEKTRFSAGGQVKTRDGRQIDFSLDMVMERRFFYESQYTYTETGAALIDPLVINLDGKVPQFLESGFSFDLDMDGTAEDLAAPMPGTAILVLDKNGDGIVNDGSELFGPATGSGFAELGAHDRDHNNWIDENDAVFDRLSLWENNDAGDMVLTGLKEAGIGAISLESMATPFEIKDQANRLQAKVSRTGMALNEDGTPVAVHQIDWAT